MGCKHLLVTFDYFREYGSRVVLVKYRFLLPDPQCCDQKSKQPLILMKTFMLLLLSYYRSLLFTKNNTIGFQ